MEEALLGQKQIRHYFKQFSEQQWNRVAKATMMLGIQALMNDNKKELFWDFQHLSLDQIEDIVVGNEIKLIQRQREMRAQSKEKKQNIIQMEKASEMAKPIQDESQKNSVQKPVNEKKVKKVTVISESQSNIEDDQSSVVPQLSNSIKKRNNDEFLHQNQQNEQQIIPTENIQKQEKRNQKISVNRRHQTQFQKHKSSEAMSQILKADEIVNNRQQRLQSGLKNSRQQPSQKEKSSYRPNIHQPVSSGNQITNKIPQQKVEDKSQPREGSRDPSYGRPSSRWRQGLSNKDNLSKLDEEEINFQLQNKNKGMTYPSWWLTQDEDKRVNSLDNIQQNRNVNRNRNGKHDEDSLDLRLRKVREGVEKNQNQNIIQMDRQDNHKMQKNSPRYKYQESQDNRYHQYQPQYQADLKNDSSSFDNYPSFDQQNINVQQSKASLPSPHSSTHLNNNILASSSTKMLNLLDSAKPNIYQPVNQQLSRTNGSQGSFAYTKGIPKYSPMRDRNPGNANIPMSYSGPPNQAEMNRDNMRQASGNRNFSQFVSQQQSQRNQNRGDIVANKLQANTVKNNHTKQNKQKEKHQQNHIDNHQVYLEQQKEAERNRLNMQRILNESKKQEYLMQSQDEEGLENSSQQNQSAENKNNSTSQIQSHYQTDDQGMQKYTKGGISMMISANPVQDERSRSGSKARYPFMDQEPFRGNDVPLRQRNDQSRNAGNRQTKNNGQYQGNNFQNSKRKIPKELNNVESTIKSKIEYDRRVYQEKQRLKEMKDYQNQKYAGDLGVTQSMNNTEVNLTNGGNYNQKGVKNQNFQEESVNQSQQPQIFYKRDDRTLIYEEGVDDSYRQVDQSSYKKQQFQQQHQQQYQNEMMRRQMMESSVQKSSQLHDSASSQVYPGQGNQNYDYPQNIYYDDYPQGQNEYQSNQNQQNNSGQEMVAGATLRRRTISPSTFKAIQSDQYEINNKNVNSLNQMNQIRNGQQQDMETLNSQFPIELHTQQRSSFVGTDDHHNETGFTQKLLYQQRNNPSISYTQIDPSIPSSSAPNGRKISDVQQNSYQRDREQNFKSNYAKNNMKNERNILNQVPPPNQYLPNQGYYDQNGEYHDQNIVGNRNVQNMNDQKLSRGGQIQKYQEQIREGKKSDEESSYTEGGGEGGEAIHTESENRNNTSRFAVGSGDEYNQKYQIQGYPQNNSNYGKFNRGQYPENYYPQKSGTIDLTQNNSSIVLKHRRGDNFSGEQSSSFINPNMSSSQTGEVAGVEKGLLKNQLEQMLMMKSGEFSAGRGQNNEVLLSSVGTASLGNDRTNSSGLASAPRPDGSAYHQYAFVNYQAQLPQSKHQVQRKDSINTYENAYAYKSSLPAPIESQNQSFNKYPERLQDFQRNQNDKKYYQDRIPPQTYSQSIQNELQNPVQQSSYQERQNINYIPKNHNPNSLNYVVPQYQKSFTTQYKDTNLLSDNRQLPMKFEVPFQAPTNTDGSKIIQQQYYPIDQKNQANFNTSQFAYTQNDKNFQGNYKANDFQIQKDTQARYYADQKLLNRPSQNTSFNQSNGSGSYKRALTNIENKNQKIEQKQIPDQQFIQQSKILSNIPQNQTRSDQNHTNNFTLQRPSMEDNYNQIRRPMVQNYYLDNSRASIPGERGNSRSPIKQNQVQVRNPQLDHRISSGKRDQRSEKQRDSESIKNKNIDIPAQAPSISNYYQTFNQNKNQKSQEQQRNYSNIKAPEQQQEQQYQNYEKDEKNETEDYGEGEDDDEDYDNMGTGEEMEGTSQMSDDHNINKQRMTQSQIQNGDDSMAYEMADNETKTENLRNFMEQAQPGNALVNSQGISQQDPTPKNQEIRKISVPPAYPINYGEHKIGQNHPSNRTDEKEGGQLEEILAQQKMMLNQYQQNQNQMIQNSNRNQYAGLAQISERQGNFISSGNSKDEYGMYKRETSEEESSPEISNTEQTSQIVTTNKRKGNEITNDDDFISSSLQETPANGENTNSLSNTDENNFSNQNQKKFQEQMNQAQLQQNMQKMKNLTEKLAIMGGNDQMKKRVPVPDYSQESCESQMKSFSKQKRQNTNTQSISVSDNNGQKQVLSNDSDESLSPLRDSEL